MDIILKYFSDFTDQQIRQFKNLEELYSEWNAKINVISRKDISSLYEKHVLHSLSIAAAFEFKPGTRIIDIGTGGGFPGIPLAIFFPEVSFLLVDSIAKKIRVVNEVTKSLELKNVEAIHARAEDIRERKCDFVVSRAVAPLKELWKWGKPLLRKNTEGGLICLKGGDLAQEIHDSNTRPRIMEIYELFAEEYFREKFLLFIPSL